MDWEIYERFRATLLMMGIVLVTCLMMSFPQSPMVRFMKTGLIHASAPMHSLLVRLHLSTPTPAENSPDRTALQASPETLSFPSEPVVSNSRFLIDENERLRALLHLQARQWPKGIAASVIGRDPRRWFQELVIDRGSEDGLSIDDPVVTAVGSHFGLVGRIVDAESHVSRVMLMHDPLSAVPATIVGREAEDGVCEGRGEHDVLLRYLDRSSGVKIGDIVVTSGLGQRFPPGIPIGIVEELSIDARQLFIEARLRPSIQGQPLHLVLVLPGGQTTGKK